MDGLTPALGGEMDNGVVTPAETALQLVHICDISLDEPKGWTLSSIGDVSQLYRPIVKRVKIIDNSDCAVARQ